MPFHPINRTPTPEPSIDDGHPDSKRQHNRPAPTQHPGSKILHLKKKDGEPLWRADIQYEFLDYVFQNTDEAFTNTYDNTEGHTFADIYIDAMARSSKTSKVLNEKLTGDRTAGVNMAMVCLLVNIGRMNTTLNFFPEMRAQLRTYHPIPSLQAHDLSDSKQIQDTPRLKSILKGACDDRPEPRTLEELAVRGKTNPINLIFLHSTFASKIIDYFPSSYEFHDLIMNHDLSSASRGRAFLWLMFAFLESHERENPFGKGLKNGTCVPAFEELTESQREQENVDSPEELAFGQKMTIERKNYLEQGPATPTVKLRVREQRHTESPPSEGEDDSKPPTKLRLVLKAPNRATRKPEKDIKSQATMREAKCQQVIKSMMTTKERRYRRTRYQQGALAREWNKIRDIDPLYDSETENFTDLTEKKRRDRDSTGLPYAKRKVGVPGDYGEECTALATAFRRSSRWLERWCPKPEEETRMPSKPILLARQFEREKREVLFIEKILEEQAERDLQLSMEMSKENVETEPVKPVRHSKKRKFSGTAAETTPKVREEVME